MLSARYWYVQQQPTGNRRPASYFLYVSENKIIEIFHSCVRD